MPNDNEVVNPSDGQPVSPRIEDLEKRPEDLKRASRIVIYGEKFKDAPVLVRALKQELGQKGIGRIDVYSSYDEANIEAAFFGRGRIVPVSDNPELEAGREAGTDIVKSSTEIEPAGNTNDNKPQEDTIPMGIIMFSTMYHYASGYARMDIDTPKDMIEKLCAEYGVPFVHASLTDETPELLGRSMASLIPPAQELTQ